MIFERVNVVTIDTDVAVLAVYFQSQLNGKIYMEYEATPNMGCYDTSLHTFDHQMVQTLPEILTVSSDCDSTSYFTGKGRYVLKICEI